MPRAWSLLGCVRDVLCVGLIRRKSVPFVRGLAFPFRDQGESRGYRKEENTKGIEGPSREPGLPFSLCQPCFDMADHVRGGVFADPCRPYPGPILASGCVPSYAGGWCGVPESQAMTPRGVIGEMTAHPSP